MCSSLTTAGSQAALQALRWGAADVIAKDASMVSAKMDDLRDELVTKLRSITGASVARAIAGLGQARTQVPEVQATPRLRADHRFKSGEFDIVLIGSSTGGPPVLETLVPMLPKGLSCPVLIAQHMPRLFTQSLSQRLAESCELPVVHGEHGMTISPGTVYMCPGATHTHVVRSGARLVLQTSDEPKAELYKPGVNVLFSTASAAVGGKVLGVVLTGMGEDGAVGAGEVRARGGTVLAQDAASCVVYGMPRAVAAAGHADGVATPAQIGAMLASLAPAQAPRAAA
jgi:two-component system chemotaxis response regulator CheB